jgi:hypothetical protein
MSHIIEFEEWSQKSNILKAITLEGILISVSLVILYIFYGSYGDWLTFFALAVMGLSFSFPIIMIGAHRKHKQSISLEELKSIYNTYDHFDPQKKESKIRAIILILIFLVDAPFAVFIVPFFLFITFPLSQLIIFSILHSVIQFLIGIGINYEKPVEERTIEIIYSKSIEDTIKVAEMVRETYDVKNMKIEIWIGESHKKIQLGITTIILTLSKHRDLEIRILCGGYWGVGLALDVDLNGMELPDEKISKKVDLGLEYKPYLEYWKDKKTGKMQIIYVPAEEEEAEEDIRDINKDEQKKLIKLLFSTIESILS